MRGIHQVATADVAALIRKAPLTRSQLAARLHLSPDAVTSHLKKLRAQFPLVEEGARSDKTFYLPATPEAGS